MGSLWPHQSMAAASPVLVVRLAFVPACSSSHKTTTPSTSTSVSPPVYHGYLTGGHCRGPRHPGYVGEEQGCGARPHSQLIPGEDPVAGGLAARDLRGIHATGPRIVPAIGGQRRHADHRFDRSWPSAHDRAARARRHHLLCATRPCRIRTVPVHQRPNLKRVLKSPTDARVTIARSTATIRSRLKLTRWLSNRGGGKRTRARFLPTERRSPFGQGDRARRVDPPRLERRMRFC
jgi:hypothetical protein